MFISLRHIFTENKRISCFKKKTKNRSGQNIKLIIIFVSLLFLLGITWISFLLYIHQTFSFYFSYFSYVFIVMNGSQVCVINELRKKGDMSLICCIFLHFRGSTNSIFIAISFNSYKKNYFQGFFIFLYHLYSHITIERKIC